MEEVAIYPTEAANSRHMMQAFGLMLQYEFDVEYSALDGAFSIKILSETRRRQCADLLEQLALHGLPFCTDETRI